MKRWAIYKSDGRIDRIYSGPESEAAIQPIGDENFAPMPDGFDDLTAYVNNGEVVPRQPFSLQISSLQITADGTDEAVITNTPAGTTVRWPDGQTDEVADGEVRFSVDLPGTYTLRFTAVEYLDKEVTIEAVPAA